MKSVTLGAVAINQTARDWIGNERRLFAALKALKKEKIAVGCFPELCICGYGCEDGFTHLSTMRYSLDILERLVPETKGIFVNFGLPFFFEKAFYNTTAVVFDRKLVGLIPKKDLAGDGIHYEPRWFKEWPHGASDVAEVFGKKVPIGDLIFNVGGVRIGYEICEEAWSSDRPAREHAEFAVDIELNPSASHFAFGKKRIREQFVREASRAFGTAYVYSNLLGCESGRQIYDGDCIVASGGNILARGERFRFDDFCFTSATIDLDVQRSHYAKFSWSEAEVTKEERIVHLKGRLEEGGDPQLPEEAPLSGGWEESSELLFEEVSRAVALGLYDYMRKSRSRGFVLSISGGCDSTSVAVFVTLMVKLGVRSIGLARFLEKLSYVSEIQGKQSEPDIVHALLWMVWQGTENNSSETRAAAKNVSLDLGARFFGLEIDSIVDCFRKQIEECLGEALSFEKHDLVLQNLQARTRNPIPWALSNASGKLLLTTSNRSESALGYATMDGDTAGGFNPIGGIGKHFLRRWLRWMETDAPVGLEPLSFLKEVNDLSPSAELRPLETRQTDEDDLGPYEILDRIELSFIHYGKSPKETFSIVVKEFGDRYSVENLYLWTSKFFALFARNQWKRERFAPCFHVDLINLDPRTWCRWPILSGGFERELLELKEAYAARADR
ncbi:MAG: NAD(+) synthase [Bdellovibrionales bacterium]|nr:NAD(+) synthase [Bdellovibrionales bacterium]